MRSTGASGSVRLFGWRYQVLVDVDVRICALDVKAGWAAWHDFWEHSPQELDRHISDPEAFVTRQERLLEALLRNGSALEMWLRSEAVSAAVSGRLDELDPGRDWPEILGPAFRFVPAASRDFYDRSLAMDRFIEASEAFAEATVSRMVSVIVGPGRPLEPVSGERVIRRHRVIADVDLWFEVIGRDRAAQCLTRAQEDGFAYGVNVSEYLDHNRRLQAAVLESAPVLGDWLRHMAFGEVSLGGAARFGEVIVREDVLAPVIEQTGPEDRDYLEGIFETGFQREGLAQFFGTLSSRIAGAAVREAPRSHADRTQEA